LLDWLFQQFPSYQVLGSKAFKPTLENTHKILDLIDHPEKDLQFVHVAGSNGKGSVCSSLASILTESGLKVGLFTSPHILKFPERIRVNGECINDEDVNTFIKRIKDSNLDFSPSFFEITFGMALDHFKNENCDICIIETGLGGRLDATNVISPLLCVITTISLEHTDMLGDTIQEIAVEKAGIIKPHANVVLGKLDSEVQEIFYNKAKVEGVKVISSDNTHITDYEKLFLAEYQKENFRTALTAIKQLIELDFEINQEHIQNGLINLQKNTGFSGRLQIVEHNPLTIFDVSHNADGIKTTLESIQSISKGDLYVVFGTSSDKDLEKITPLLPRDSRYFITEFSNPRSAKIEDLKIAFERINLESANYYKNATDALKDAKSEASESDTILVIGSFFLLSDFF